MRTINFRSSGEIEAYRESTVIGGKTRWGANPTLAAPMRSCAGIQMDDSEPQSDWLRGSSARSFGVDLLLGLRSMKLETYGKTTARFPTSGTLGRGASRLDNEVDSDGLLLERLRQVRLYDRSSPIRWVARVVSCP